MRLEVAATAELAAAHAARAIGAGLAGALEARGRATLALSGGATPVRMLEYLAREEVDWSRIEVMQVDERWVGEDDSRRNARLLEPWAIAAGLPAARLHLMRVGGDGFEPARKAYEHAVEGLAGRPPVLDVVHLGLGEDGHTASLVPNHPALECSEAVAVTAAYRGTRRMTLTGAVLRRARRQVWLVTGPAKREALHRMIDGDMELIATGVVNERAVVVADPEAAGRLTPETASLLR